MATKDNSILETVYNTIKTKILYLEFRPGKSISVATLAKALNVSRTPVHDTIMKLSEENLIEVFPKSGSRVSLIDIKKTEDERFIRKSLELQAIKTMFYNYDSSVLETMEKCIQKHEQAFIEKNYINTLYWDSQFHFQIFKCINKEYCWQIATRYSANEYRVRLLAEKAISSTQESVIQNHRDIIRFIRNRNLDEVLHIEEQHLSRISTEIAILVAAFPSIFVTTNKTAIPTKIRTKEDYNENFLTSIQQLSNH